MEELHYIEGGGGQPLNIFQQPSTLQLVLRLAADKLKNSWRFPHISQVLE